MGLLDVLIAGLAGYRLAALLVLEEGPFGVFERLRAWAGVDGDERPFVGGVLGCLYCCSVWTTAVAALLLVHPATYIAAAVVAAMSIPLLAQGIARR